MKIQRIGTVTCKVGEGPVWDVAEQVLYFIDVAGRMIWRYTPTLDEFANWPVESEIGSLALRRNGGAVVSLRTGLHTFDFTTGKAALIADPQPDNKQTQFNDGKVDAHGRFVVGTIDTEFTRPVAALYRLDPDLAVTELLGNVILSNGPCWSPDNRTFYFSDSMTYIVSAFDYDLATGNISNRRVFADAKDWGGGPDGATVDADGRYWVAVCGAGKILCLKPDGSLDRTIEVPMIPLVSSVMFGGPNLDRLYVTSIGAGAAGIDGDCGSDGGGLFVIDGLGATGKPEPRFAG